MLPSLDFSLRKLNFSAIWKDIAFIIFMELLFIWRLFKEWGQIFKIISLTIFLPKLKKI